MPLHKISCYMHHKNYMQEIHNSCFISSIMLIIKHAHSNMYVHKFCMLLIQPITYKTGLFGLIIQKNSIYNTTSKSAVTRSIAEKFCITNNIQNWTFRSQNPEKQHVQYRLETSSNKINSRKIMHVIHSTDNIPIGLFDLKIQKKKKQHVQYNL